MTTNQNPQEPEPLNRHNVCLPCARTRPAKIERHHAASRVTAPDLVVPTCRRNGAYCHDVLTEQQRSHGTPLRYDAAFTSEERDLAVINGTADVVALTLRHAAVDGLAQEIEDLARDAAQVVNLIGLSTPPIDSVTGPDPRRTTARRMQHSSASTAAKRFREPRRRQPPTGRKAELIDQIRLDQCLHLFAGFATALLGPDDQLARDLHSLADQPGGVYHGLQLLDEAGGMSDFRSAGDDLNDRTRAAAAPISGVADLDGVADLLSGTGEFLQLWPLVFRFLVDLSAAVTGSEAVAALASFRAALPPT